MKKLTIATRGSRLALWQANYIADCVSKKHGITTELLVLKTKGDIILDVPLAKVGGKGLFVKEIEEALLDGRADIAVHSMKDVPMQLPLGLTLGVVPKREIAWDVLLSVHYANLDALPKGAKIGTSSLRRQAQILHKRPDCCVEFLRGNVETRIRKLMEGQYDAIIMAAAGLKRLELETPHMFLLSPPEFLPAVGQGALGIEFNENRIDLLELFSFLNHQETYDCVSAERSFLAGLEGGCQVPIAGYATIDTQAVAEQALTLEGFVADVTGTRIVRKTIKGERKKAKELGVTLAEQIKKAGGGAILQELYATGDICQN